MAITKSAAAVLAALKTSIPNPQNFALIFITPSNSQAY
jgi:hypothetical protein